MISSFPICILYLNVIEHRFLLLVKRVQYQLDGSLLLISDNNVYPPITLNPDTDDGIEIIGKVVNISKDFC